MNSRTLKYGAVPSSPPVPLLPICFISVFSLSPSHLSLPLCLSCHSLSLSLSLLITLPISTHTFSIKLAYQFSFGFFLLNQREQEQPTRLPGYCTAHVRCSSLLLGSCYISTLTDSIPLSVCLFSIYSPLVIVAPFLTNNGRYVLSGVPYSFFGDEDGRFGVLS